MHRRLFVTGLLGVAGTAGIAALLPRQALAAVPMGPTPYRPQPNSVLPDLSAPADGPYEPDELDELGEQDELEEGVQLANHRRHRVRRWRNRCRWRWINGHRRWRCRRESLFLWLWF
jgi:hypothetical protein